MLDLLRTKWFAARGWVLAAPFLLLLWSRLVSDAPLRYETLAVVAAGMLLRAWAGRHLGPHGNGARAEAPAVATTGPYAFSRHPLYLANVAVGAGLVLFANSLPAWASLTLILFLLAHHILLALWEEKALRRLRPDDYDAYARAVPRWFGVKPPEEGAIDRHSPPERGTAQGRNLIHTALCVAALWAAACL
jgi:protein-S-isoprenylcysteine O-methyltransferase Ste14